MVNKSYYESKLNEYFKLMQVVFEQQYVDMNRLIDDIDVELESTEYLNVQVKIGSCKIGKNFDTAKVVVHTGLGWYFSILTTDLN